MNKKIIISFVMILILILLINNVCAEEINCVDGDGSCHCKCVGKDSDCEGVTIKCEGEPEDQQYFPDVDLVCEYDGVCYADCDYDFDCECMEPESEQCKTAIAVLKGLEPDTSFDNCATLSDGLCDVECKYGEDPDCDTSTNWTVILISVLVIAAVILFIVIVLKKHRKG